jgi:hypothetical protein
MAPDPFYRISEMAPDPFIIVDRWLQPHYIANRISTVSKLVSTVSVSGRLDRARFMDWTSDRSSADDRVGIGNGATSAPDPSPREPVTAVMNIRPKRASVGETFEVVVHTRIASVHFIHAKDDAGGPFVPVDVSIKIFVIACKNDLIRFRSLERQNDRRCSWV